jgi:hypothetical protein
MNNDDTGRRNYRRERWTSAKTIEMVLAVSKAEPYLGNKQIAKKCEVGATTVGHIRRLTPDLVQRVKNRELSLMQANKLVNNRRRTTVQNVSNGSFASDVIAWVDLSFEMFDKLKSHFSETNQ